MVVGAGLEGQSAIALGNVLGSNIANIGLILGASAMIGTVIAQDVFIRRDLPFMVAICLALLPLGWLLGLGALTALLLLAAMVSYLWVLYRSERSTVLVMTPEIETAGRVMGETKVRDAFLLLASIAILILGADILVDAAVGVAVGMGVSERTIGLTLVAFGTSLPEAAGCLVAVIRRQGDIVLGNIVGSNIFNTLLVLPVGLLVEPVTPSRGDLIDIVVMSCFSIGLFLLMRRRSSLTRGAGVALFAAYFLYIGALFRGAL